MMLKTGSSGLALLLTILSLLAFAFMAFMGLEYLLEGNHLVAVLICLGGMALLGLCIRMACWGKETRKKKQGYAIEILSLLAAGIILYFGRTPFSQFVYVVNHQQDINNLVVEARDRACKIDTAYDEYAHKRLAAYERYLKKTVKDNQHTVSMKVRSLERRLLPEDMTEVQDERKDWLDQLQNVNVWNIATAKNLGYLISASDDWVKQYADVSNFMYEGERCEPFVMQGDDIKDRYKEFTTPRTPDRLSNIAMAVCCLLILTFYIVSLRSKSRYKGRRA
ncbi:MAG: hypothetical protein IKX18_03585 [Muribaculaceae bacterium]|nr:hypothetical protein [Muribaculaceae bacterium]